MILNLVADGGNYTLEPDTQLLFFLLIILCWLSLFVLGFCWWSMVIAYSVLRRSSLGCSIGSLSRLGLEGGGGRDETICSHLIITLDWAALTLATSWWSLFDWEDCSRLALSEPSYRLVGYSHYVDYHVHISREELQLQVWTGRALAVCWRLRALTWDWRLGALTGDWREEASCSGRTATFNSSIPLNVD